MGGTIMKFKWTVEFTVDESWVADGFIMTDHRAHDMLANDLQSAYSHEIHAKVIKHPDLKRVAKVQGYNNDIEVKQTIESGRFKAFQR